MRFLFRSLLGVFLFTLSVALLAAAGYTIYAAVQASMAEGDRPRMAQERVFAVRLVTVESGTATPVLETFGEVRARRALDLRAPIGGRVAKLADGFEDGAMVRAGDLLMRLDDDDARAARDMAQADLRRAEAELREAERATQLAQEDLEAAVEQRDLRARALARQQDLAGRGVGSEAAVETAELALSSARQAVVSRRQAVAQTEANAEQAETALARQRLALAEAERRLADTTLHAAFDGTLSEVSVAAGGLLTANERIARLIDPAELEVSFRVSTAQYSRLLGDDGALVRAPMEIGLDVMDTEIMATGRLDRVGASVGEGQTGRLIYARLDAAPGFLPGDFVTVRVREPALEQVARLPATAVDAGSTVLVLDGSERLEEAAVEILRRQGDDVLVRAAGLDGAEVVAERAPTLGEGIRVRPVRPDPPPPGADAGAADDEPRAKAAMVELSPERRAELIAFVEGNDRMPEPARQRLIAQLSSERVPAQVVERLESRMRGG